MNARQRGGFQQAAQQGQGQQWLGARPNIQARANAAAPGSWRATNMQNFLQTGQAQPRGGAPPAPTATPQPPTMQGTAPPGNVGMSGGNPNPYFAGGFGTPGGDQLTAAGMAQLGQNAGGYGFRPPPMNAGGGYVGGPLGNYGGGMAGGMGAQGAAFSGYSPAMQQILQARGLSQAGAGGGGMGPWGMAGGSMGQPQYGGMVGGPRGNYGGGGASAPGSWAQGTGYRPFSQQPMGGAGGGNVPNLSQTQQQAGGGASV